MHEDFSRKETIKTSSDRTFGLGFAAIFAVIGLLPLAGDPANPVRPLWLLAAVCFAACGLFWTAALAPLNRLWIGLGLALFRVVNPVVLGLIFYLTIYPIGLALRLKGKDPLRLRGDAAADSYWIPRDPPGPSPESMKDQF